MRGDGAATAKQNKSTIDSVPSDQQLLVQEASLEGPSDEHKFRGKSQTPMGGRESQAQKRRPSKEEGHMPEMRQRKKHESFFVELSSQHGKNMKLRNYHSN